MQVIERLLDQAAQMVKEGRSDDAARLLQTIIEEQPENDTAWYWRVRASQSHQERVRIANHWVRRIPESSRARQVLQHLNNGAPAPARQFGPKVALRRVTRSRLLAWSMLFVFVALTISIVVPLYEGMTARSEALEDQVILLGNQNHETQFDYQGLWDEYSNLQKEYRELSGDFSFNDQTLVDMRASYDRLKADHNQLLRDYTQLEARYHALNSQFRSYQGQAVTPPFITIQGRSIDLAFRKLNGSQLNWSIPFDRYELELERGMKARSGLFGMGMPVLRLTQNPDQEIWVTDFRGFMDSSPFVNVMTDVYEQSPDDRTFITETWSMVGQMITYVFEEDEIPRYPLETLVSGGGDCEDTAVLFASMIRAAKPEWTLELVYMNSKSPSDPQGFSDHVIVFIDTGLEHYYIETTRTDVMEPYTEGVVGWFLPLDG
jgi:hypothetical protein